MAVLIMSAMGLYGKRFSVLIAEKPVARSIEFAVYAGSDYSSPLYKKSSAKVVLSLYRFADNSRELLWEGEVNEGSVKNYPSETDPIIKRVTLYNVFEKRETIVASYKVIYDALESELSYEDGMVLTRGEKENSVAIKI